MESVECPECVTAPSFYCAEEYYKHAATDHLSLNFSELYIDDVFLNNGKCKICPDVTIDSFKVYVEHYGGFHKLVQRYMTPRTLEKFLVLEAARNPVSNVTENDQTKILVKNEHRTCPKCDTSLDAARYNNNNNNNMRNAKEQLKKYQCPECNFGANFVSTIYAHSAMKHHYAKIAGLRNKRFMLNDENCCSECPMRLISEAGKYVLHIGGKHRAMVQFLTPKLASLYAQLPKKKNYIGYELIDGHKSFKCLLCSQERFFATIAEYKQHLASQHYRKNIADMYKTMYRNNWKKTTCFFCANEKEYCKSSALIIHLGSKHNFILDYASSIILEQLKPFNVLKD